MKSFARRIPSGRSAVGALSVTLAASLALAAPGHAAAPTSGGGAYVDRTKLSHNLDVESLAVDAKGGLHEIGSAGAKRTVYATKQPRGSRFTYRAVVVPKDEPSGIEKTLIAPTIDGKKIVAVTTVCDSVLVTRVSRTAKTLGFTSQDQATAGNRCGNDSDGGDSSPDLLAITPLANNLVALLFRGDPQHAVQASAPEVLIGKPGGTFHATTLPGSSTVYNDFVIARDFPQGKLVVAGLGDYDASLGGQPIDVWTVRSSLRSWGNPHQATVLAEDPDSSATFRVTSIAASHEQLWVSYVSQPSFHQDREQASVVHRARNGTWGDPVNIGPSNVRGANLLLEAAPTQKVAVFVVDNAAKTHAAHTGNLELRQSDGARFTKPRALTSGRRPIYEFTIVANDHHSVDYAYLR